MIYNDIRNTILEHTQYTHTFIILVSIIACALIVLNINLIYNSNNAYRHKNSDSLYAHFSAIDSYNYFIFPKLLLAHPFRYTLTAGQSLYIPKQWWHWVKTTKKTFAVNYWIMNKQVQAPFIFKHAIDYDITLLDSEIVKVWKSDENSEEVSFYQTFREFYDSGLNDRYVITLSDYELGETNGNIKQKMANYITFPVDKRIQCDEAYSYNIWISSNTHDTGLHYDDEDGVLTVMSGEKEITLFPPSDSKYLYPYNVEYAWKNIGDALNFRYNTFTLLNEVPGVSSGELLYVTCNNDKRVLSNISKIYNDTVEITKLIWGFKKVGDVYRWEVYIQSLHNIPVRITSMDIYKNQYDMGDEIHYYFKMDDTTPVELPFWGYGKYKKDNKIHYESNIFVVDSYSAFHDKYDEYMTKLGYSEIKDKFKNIILKKYTCYEMCIGNKNPKQIFCQYLGLSNDEFLEFLTTNKYPDYVIDFVKKNVADGAYNINNEIAIVYDIDTQTAIRSGFYGVI